MDEESDSRNQGEQMKPNHELVATVGPSVHPSIRLLPNTPESLKHRCSRTRAYLPRLLKQRLRLPVIVVAAIVFLISVSDIVLRPDQSAPSAKDRTVDTIATDLVLDLKVERLVQKHRVDLNRSLTGPLSPWQIASAWVTAREIIPDFAPRLGAILGALARAKVTQASASTLGTQLEATLELQHQQMVVFKPMFYERSTFLALDGVLGRDRHNAEVASFHLSRILNLRRVPLVVGRKINLRTEVMPVATAGLKKTFYIKEDRDCFYGACQHCSAQSGVCTRDGLVEGAIILWLPPEVVLSKVQHPWMEGFKTAILKKYEESENSSHKTYCDVIRRLDVYRRHRFLLLDIMDTAVFDFLIGNNDRHHFEFTNDTDAGMLVMLDNGKSFGNPYYDDVAILAPLQDCCMLRTSTWNSLQLLRDGVLSRVLKEVLRSDPIHPVLIDSHFLALDRRLKKVLQELDTCVQTTGLDNVLVDDGL
ncbi:LOW QUALITY PROTEIN: glycosaminoglycan xylosylkinase-like [Pomacea canaliculata]|uniref:LOW QUALITY PROTEIN: glycosaminoglycan xylosylkinase-like n=1 Tax=Pomacea canaliculata TaxID=400727 RepID=UPI000D72F2F1|nr:LOW QUALITY PROTEIN: glycosaminoglycan xylosylkinase-like [Pomacea canaliculata]